MSTPLPCYFLTYHFRYGTWLEFQPRRTEGDTGQTVKVLKLLICELLEVFKTVNEGHWLPLILPNDRAWMYSSLPSYPQSGNMFSVFVAPCCCASDYRVLCGHALWYDLPPDGAAASIVVTRLHENDNPLCTYRQVMRALPRISSDLVEWVGGGPRPLTRGGVTVDEAFCMIVVL